VDRRHVEEFNGIEQASLKQSKFLAKTRKTLVTQVVLTLFLIF